MLPLVSDTAIVDAPPADPKFERIWPIDPPADLLSLELFTRGQPFDAFKEMRERAPVLWQRELYVGGNEGPGFWSVTRYEDVKRVELDPETFSSQKGGINIAYGAPETRHPQLFPATLNTLISLDRPTHFELRREHMPYFNASYARALRGKVEAKIDALLDAMAARGPRLDMVEHFSAQLPLFTLCEMLGFPEADRPKVAGWMHELENAADTVSRQTLGEIDEAFLMRFLGAMDEMFAYGRDILKKRRADPKDDLLSAIACAKIEGDFLSDEYLDGSWLLIIFAGNDTTRNSLSGTMRLLTENPGERAKLIADPDLTPAMANEAIRLVSPVIHMRRTATRDAEIAGQRIGEGEKVVMWYGAANRDPSVFPDPDRFDVTRANAKDHIAFGRGPHVCLGQHIAEMQLDAAYRKILARFPEIAATGEMEIAPNNFVHAISKLEVDLGAA